MAQLGPEHMAPDSWPRALSSVSLSMEEEGLNVGRSGFAATIHSGLKTDETARGAGKRAPMSLLDSLPQKNAIR